MDSIALLRICAFLSLLALMLLWERAAPRRPVRPQRWFRCLHNLLLICVGTLLVRLLSVLAPAHCALLAAERDWGLFHADFWVAPAWLTAVCSFLLLDLLIYGQHVLFHRSNTLWRLHRVHHSDTEFDVSTGVRFHPLEIVVSMCIKSAAVLLLGLSLYAVVVFELVLNLSSLFNHGNVRLPRRLDRSLRRVIVTPDMHRVHHAVPRAEHDSNYGFSLSWWDHLFGTYRAQPSAGHEAMELGLAEFREPRWRNSLWLLLQPFQRIASAPRPLPRRQP